MGSLAASGREVSVVKGLAETRFFAHSVGSGYIKDVVESKVVWKVARISNVENV